MGGALPDHYFGYRVPEQTPIRQGVHLDLPGSLSLGGVQGWERSVVF